MQQENPLRALPSVNDLLADPRVAELEAERGHALAVAAARTALAEARESVGDGGEPGDLGARTVALAGEIAAPRLRRVLNATGVVVHTNLGRAPLADEALERVREAAAGYSNLEYDLEAGDD